MILYLYNRGIEMIKFDMLLNDYREDLNKLVKDLKKFEQEFPYLNIEDDILKQINLPLLESFSKIISNLSLTKKELEIVQISFDYYKKNKDLDLTLLLVQDTSCLNFINLIKNIYKKMLLYKIDKITSYQIKIETLKRKINLLNYIQDLFEKEELIDIKALQDKIISLNLSRDLLLELLKRTTEHNLAIQEKHTKKVNPEIGFNIEILNDYFKKIDFALSSLKKVEDNEKIYLLQSNLVELKSRLISLREDYNLCEQMIKERQDDISYLIETREETILKIKKCLVDFHNLMHDFENISSKEEVITNPKDRNIIFLNQTFKDLDSFSKENCLYPVRKKLYNMLQDLKNDKLNPANTVTVSQNDFPIYEGKGSNIIGSPRLFFQIINGQIIVLLLGIAGQNKTNLTKNTLESRIRLSSNNEYKTLYNAFKLVNIYPNEKSTFDTNLTNKEYLDKLLNYYLQREEEFWQLFSTKCYSDEEKKR